MIHLGAHGTLEWLPGKAVALQRNLRAGSRCSAPTPVIYPFIVNNPGEAAQAKRRIGAVTIGHLTPPLIAAGSHGAALELEGLFDEFAEAQALDPRRARAIAALILERGAATGSAPRNARREDRPPEEALLALDAWLCDLKDMRIGDGLHVFGRSPDERRRLASAPLARCFDRADELAERARRLRRGGDARPSRRARRALRRRRVRPARRRAGGSTCCRPGATSTPSTRAPCRPATPGRSAAARPRRCSRATRRITANGRSGIVLDLWGSATMRTGGDDLAQAFALLGVRPRWDAASNRVSGFEILPLADARPAARRRDACAFPACSATCFPTQIALLRRGGPGGRRARRERRRQSAAPALEGASLARIFGAAPGAYGVGLGRAHLARARGAERDELGEAYLDATSHAYDARARRAPRRRAFRARVGGGRRLRPCAGSAGTGRARCRRRRRA